MDEKNMLAEIKKRYEDAVKDPNPEAMIATTISILAELLVYYTVAKENTCEKVFSIASKNLKEHMDVIWYRDFSSEGLGKGH